MNKSEAEQNVNFQRAMILLNRAESPIDLTTFWRLTGKFKGKCPPIERVVPWYKGLEHLLKR